MSYFISVDALAEALVGPTPPVLLDLRYDPGKGSAPDRYAAGHLVGARFARLESVFADPEATGAGSAPLPRPEALQESLRALGLDRDTDVVVYDDTSGGPAARAWWVLGWAGARRVRVLDGGLRAWTAAGRDVVTTEEPPPAPGTFTVEPGGRPAVDVTEVAKLVEEGLPRTVLVDTRGRPQFTAGHIPAARNRPQPTFTTADGTLADRETVTAAAPDPDSDIVLYCGAGVSSAYAALALAEHGVTATLYPGSFSEWAVDTTRPVERD